MISYFKVTFDFRGNINQLYVAPGADVFAPAGLSDSGHDNPVRAEVLLSDALRHFDVSLKVDHLLWVDCFYRHV